VLSKHPRDFLGDGLSLGVGESNCSFGPIQHEPQNFLFNLKPSVALFELLKRDWIISSNVTSGGGNIEWIALVGWPLRLAE
jgi:hypothetical protein